MNNLENSMIIYQDENEITKVLVRFYDEDLWLTQKQIAEIYDTTQQNIDQHIKNIYADEELKANSTYKNFLLVRPEGNRQVERMQSQKPKRSLNFTVNEKCASLPVILTVQ